MLVCVWTCQPSAPKSYYIVDCRSASFCSPDRDPLFLLRRALRREPELAAERHEGEAVLALLLLHVGAHLQPRGRVQRDVGRATHARCKQKARPRHTVQGAPRTHTHLAPERCYEQVLGDCKESGGEREGRRACMPTSGTVPFAWLRRKNLSLS